MTRLDSQAGLTLVEALVSLFVFSLLSAGAVTVLVQSLTAQEQAQAAQSKLRDLQLTQSFVSADMAELVDRPVRMVDGGTAGAFVGVDGGRVLAEFTRTDKGAQHSVARVSYVFDGQTLKRRVVRELDAIDAAPVADERVMMDDLTSARMEFSRGQGWVRSWNSASAGAPAMVALVVTSGRYGELRVAALAKSP